MSDEVTYDAASQVEVIKGHPRDEAAGKPLLCQLMVWDVILDLK